MSYRYVALINHRVPVGERIRTVESGLSAAGLQHRLTLGSLDLFASTGTPTLAVGDGVILLGHLFSQDGSPVLDGTQIPTFANNTQLRKYLLDHFWGDYLVIQQMQPDPHSWAITRESSGGVPCVYSYHNGSGFLTSDISLATCANLYQTKIDWDHVTHCVAYPHQKTRRTGLADVSELLPGCTLRLTDAVLSTEQDWSPWEYVARERRHTDICEAAADVRSAVACAVRAWAQVDRSVLVELSGGLDSSIVAACLRQTQARVTCCTLTTPVPGTDERQYARLIAKELGVELQTETLDFDNASISFTPSTNTASPRIGCLQHAVSRLMGAAGSYHDVASFFSGSGGDTVFCYLTNSAPAADAFKERGVSAGISAIRDLSALHQCTLWTAARLTARKLLRTSKAPRSPHSAFVDPAIVAPPPERHPWMDAPADALPGDRERVAGLVDTQLYRDMSPRGAERWLRMPLLAQPVVEACLKTPSWMWITGGRNRSVARAAFADLLPEAIAHRRSKGNFLGYLGALYRRNRGGIREFLLSGLLHERRLLNTTELNRFLSRDDLPTRDRLFLVIFDLCMIENWLRHQR